MKKYIENLNWYGFMFVFVVTSLGALANEMCTSLIYWVMLMGLFGFPASLVVLFIGRKRD